MEFAWSCFALERFETRHCLVLIDPVLYLRAKFWVVSQLNQALLTKGTV